MVPGRAVVAGPGHGIALAAGIARARHHERALVGAEREQAVIGRTRVLHAVDVVDLTVVAGAGGEIVAGDAVLRVERHRLRRGVEDRGLVHVVPEAGNAVIKEALVERAPPRARLGLGEIGEDGRAGPDRRDIVAAVGVLDEFVAALAAGVGRVTSIDLGDVQVGDRDQLDPLRLHVGDELRHVGEGLGVGGEGAVAVLIVDVEPDHVGRHAVGAQVARDLADFVGGHVAVARLLIAERPFRRERRAAGQPGVAAGDVGEGRPGDEIIVDRAVGAAERERLGILVAEVEPGAIGVVEQDPVAAACRPGRGEEGDRLVDRVVRAREAERVGVPVDERLAAPVEPAGLVAETVEMLADRQRLGQREGLAVDARGRGIGRDDLAVERLEGHRTTGTDADTELRGGEAVGGGHHRRARCALRGEDGPAGVLGIDAAARDADADEIVAERDQLHLERAGGDFDAVLGRGERRGEGSALRVRGDRGERQRDGGEQQREGEAFHGRSFKRLPGEVIGMRAEIVRAAA